MLHKHDMVDDNMDTIMILLHDHRECPLAIKHKKLGHSPSKLRFSWDNFLTIVLLDMLTGYTYN
jgi:hypothetical protein